VCVIYSGRAPTITSTATCIRGGGGVGGTGGFRMGGGSAPNGLPGASETVLSL
jgi:hypothetical protein